MVCKKKKSGVHVPPYPSLPFTTSPPPLPLHCVMAEEHILKYRAALLRVLAASKVSDVPNIAEIAAETGVRRTTLAHYWCVA